MSNFTLNLLAAGSVGLGTLHLHVLCRTVSPVVVMPQLVPEPLR